MSRRDQTLIKRTHHILLISSLGLLVACGGGDGDDSNDLSGSSYKVTFDSSWSETTHPTNYPSNAHLSPIVVVSHSNQVILWEEGQLASPGTKQIAETGKTNIFITEVNSAIQLGTAKSVSQGSGGFDSPGKQSINIEVDTNFPQITFLTMIAPSPDWIGGAHIDSFMENGSLIETITVDVIAYDVGTDSGVSYASADSVTSPQGTIEGLLTDSDDSSFTSSTARKVGTLTLTKQ